MDLGNKRRRSRSPTHDSRVKVQQPYATMRGERRQLPVGDEIGDDPRRTIFPAGRSRHP